METGRSQGSRPYLERISRLAVFYELTKPGIAGYVMVTAGVGYLVAAGGQAAWGPKKPSSSGTS
jgi:heme O synthase-like polyprenyltransferase